MYGKLVYNTYDNLYREPYAFKAYDIIYILVAVFEKLGYRNIEIEDELLDKTTFSSVESISQFILSI
jgi:hypothetical protein